MSQPRRTWGHHHSRYHLCNILLEGTSSTVIQLGLSWRPWMHSSQEPSCTTDHIWRILMPSYRNSYGNFRDTLRCILLHFMLFIWSHKSSWSIFWTFCISLVIRHDQISQNEAYLVVMVISAFWKMLIWHSISFLSLSFSSMIYYIYVCMFKCISNCSILIWCIHFCFHMPSRCSWM